MDSLSRASDALDMLLEEWVDIHANLMVNRLTFEEALAAQQEEERTVSQQIRAEEQRLAAIAEADRQARLAEAAANFRGELLWPVPGFFTISSGYGNRPNPFNRSRTQFHSGIDIAGRGINGTNVVASADGLVIRAASGWNGGWGTMVIVDHGGGMTTLYAHLSALLVSEGQMVHRGQDIGRVGSTGSSTGPHLHFEVQVNRRHTDPMPFLR